MWSQNRNGTPIGLMLALEPPAAAQKVLNDYPATGPKVAYRKEGDLSIRADLGDYVDY